MKILMFGHKRMPSRSGGVELVVEELSTRMAAMGHRVTCCSRGGYTDGDVSREKDRGEYRGVRRVTVPTIDKKGLSAVTASISAAIYSVFSGADVVHIHAEGPALMCWLPKLFGKRVVVTVHGLDWQREKWKRGFASKYIRLGEKAAVSFADEIIVLSKNLQTYFRDTYGRETVCIPNGVNRPERAEVREIRERWGLEKDGYFLFLGRLVPEKGVHYLLDAFRNVNTDKKLVIAGASSDTDAYAASLMQREDDRVVFTGFVQGRLLEELYSNAWVYVLPSDLEGMPLSLLEAMSYGNCCVTSDIAECAEVMEDHGYLFPRGDAAALGQLLQTLCDDPGAVEEKRKNAADFICDKCSWDDVTEQTLKCYR